MIVLNLLFVYFILNVVAGEHASDQTMKEMMSKLVAFNDKMVEFESIIRQQNEHIAELREVTSNQAKVIHDLREDIAKITSKNQGDVADSISRGDDEESYQSINYKQDGYPFLPIPHATESVHKGNKSEVQGTSTAKHDIISTTQNATTNVYSRKKRLLLAVSTPAPTTERAFYAYMSNNLLGTKDNVDIKFDTVITNIGSCYHPNLGVFIADTTGTYVFTWTIRIAKHHSLVSTHIVINSNVVGALYVDSNADGDQGSGSTTVVAHVSAGSFVFVNIAHTFHTAVDIISDENSRSSFAGWKI